MTVAKRVRRVPIPLLLLTAIFLIPGATAADTMSHPLPFMVNGPIVEDPCDVQRLPATSFQIPQFDPNLGELTSVGLSLQIDSSLSATWQNNTGGEKRIDARDFITFAVVNPFRGDTTFPGGQQLVVSRSSDFCRVITPDGSIMGCDLVVQAQDSIAFGSSIDEYVGPDSIIFEFSDIGGPLGSSERAGARFAGSRDCPTNVSFGVQTSGLFQVDYQFEPSFPVPPPPACSDNSACAAVHGLLL